MSIPGVTGRTCACLLAIGGLLLGGCGGGGGGNGTSISVSPRSVSFTAEQAAPLPAPVDVSVHFSGDGLIVGYPRGVSPPDWLDASFGNDASEGTIHLAVKSTSYTPPATLTTTLRAVTGHADGSDIQIVDIPITYTVTGQPLAVNVNPGALQFTAVENGSLPQAQTVVQSYNGSVGDVDPATVPSWLSVTRQSSGAGQASYSVQPNTTAQSQGSNLAATVNFYTSRGGNGGVAAGVRVSYQFVAPMQLAPSSLNYTLVKGSGQQPTPADSRSFTISGDDLAWTAAADQSWIHLNQTSGTGAATVSFTLNAAAQPLGGSQAHIAVTNANTGQIAQIAVDLKVSAPKLVAQPSQAAFNVNAQTTAAQAQAVIQLTDEIGGKDSSQVNSWTLGGVDVPWLSVSPASGSVPPNGSLTIKLVPAQLGNLANGAFSGTVTLHYSTADTPNGVLVIPVSLSLALPRVSSVAPHVATAGVSRKFILRGTGFTDASAGQMRFGGTAGGSGFQVVNDNEIDIDIPALASGTVPVSLANQLQVPTSTANLAVLAPQTFAAATIPSQHRKKRLVWDAERTILYAADDEDNTLKRFRFSNGSWTAEFVPGPSTVYDIALASDGKTLVVAAAGGIYRTSLDQEPLQFAGPFASNTLKDGIFFPWSLQATKDGRMLVIDDLRGTSGYTPIYIYDLSSDSAAELGLPGGPIANSVYSGRSADGSSIYFGSGNSSSGYLFSSATNLLSPVQFSTLIQGVAVSRNASRVVLDASPVYDRNTTLLGTIDGRSFSVSMSPDEKLAYSVYTDFNNSSLPQYLNVYDLSQPPDGNGKFPLKQSTPLTTDPGETYANDILTLVTEDGKTLFLSGAQNLQVIPLGN